MKKLILILLCTLSVHVCAQNHYQQKYIQNLCAMLDERNIPYDRIEVAEALDAAFSLDGLSNTFVRVPGVALGYLHPELAGKKMTEEERSAKWEIWMRDLKTLDLNTWGTLEHYRSFELLVAMAKAKTEEKKEKLQVEKVYAAYQKVLREGTSKNIIEERGRFLIVQDNDGNKFQVLRAAWNNYPTRKKEDMRK